MLIQCNWIIIAFSMFGWFLNSLTFQACLSNALCLSQSLTAWARWNNPLPQQDCCDVLSLCMSGNHLICWETTWEDSGVLKVKQPRVKGNFYSNLTVWADTQFVNEQTKFLLLLWSFSAATCALSCKFHAVSYVILVWQYAKHMVVNL